MISWLNGNFWCFTRFGYCLNNPLIYTDPSGMRVLPGEWEWRYGERQNKHRLHDMDGGGGWLGFWDAWTDAVRNNYPNTLAEFSQLYEKQVSSPNFDGRIIYYGRIGANGPCTSSKVIFEGNEYIYLSNVSVTQKRYEYNIVASNGGDVYSGDNIFVETYWHYQFGGGKDLNVSTSALNIRGISMRTPEIQNIVKQGSGYINMLSYMKNQTGFAIGNVKFNYLGNNTFLLSPDEYDFNIRWSEGGTSRNWATFTAGLLHGPVIDNIPLSFGPLFFGPSVYFGGPYQINFRGTVTLKP